MPGDAVAFPAGDRLRTCPPLLALLGLLGTSDALGSGKIAFEDKLWKGTSMILTAGSCLGRILLFSRTSLA